MDGIIKVSTRWRKRELAIRKRGPRHEVVLDRRPSVLWGVPVAGLMARSVERACQILGEGSTIDRVYHASLCERFERCLSSTWSFSTSG